jgi:hypothetical protein
MYDYISQGYKCAALWRDLIYNPKPFLRWFPEKRIIVLIPGTLSQGTRADS